MRGAIRTVAASRSLPRADGRNSALPSRPKTANLARVCPAPNTAFPLAANERFGSASGTPAISSKNRVGGLRLHPPSRARFMPREVVEDAPGCTVYSYQTVSGAHDMQARFYSPVYRRFLNEDPSGFAGGTNMYAFAGGDPVNLMDPFGLGPTSAWSGAGAAALQGAGSYITGLGNGVWNAAAGTVNAALHPIDTVDNIANGLGTLAGRAIYDTSGLASDIGNGVVDTVTDPSRLGNAVGNLVGGVAIGAGVNSAASALRGAGELSGTALARQLGQAGEDAVGITGPKVSIQIPGSGQIRIPDGLNATTLTEVKNVGTLSYTQQLRDFTTYSQANGLDFQLWVRPTTKLTGPLQQAVANGHITLKLIP